MIAIAGAVSLSLSRFATVCWTVRRFTFVQVTRDSRCAHRLAETKGEAPQGEQCFPLAVYDLIASIRASFLFYVSAEERERDKERDRERSVDRLCDRLARACWKDCRVQKGRVHVCLAIYTNTCV